MSSRCSAAVTYLAVLASATQTAYVGAVTTSWNTDFGGSFTTSANWDLGVPTSQDTAVFNRGPIAYSVSFPGGSIFDPPPSYLINYLRVHTNDVTFRDSRSPDATSPSLTVANPDVSIVIGETAGEVAILNNLLRSLSGANTSIGRNEGATGTLNVSSGTFSMSGEISIGRSGTGTLNVTAGSQVQSSSAILGHLEMGEGEANVSGADSVWTNTNGLIIGHVGVGTLNISERGRVQSGFGRLGQHAEGEGHAIVSGFNSQWNSSSVDVGFEGTGSLTIREGGLVSGIYGTIGTEPGSSGTVLVTGAGSTWQPSHLSVGGSGAGTLTIDAGGAVPHVLTSRIGLGSDGSGTATISGEGSSLTTDVLDVGYNGAGTLRIEAGGSVSTEDSANIGLNANSTGTVTVSGVDSSLSTGEVAIGRNGTGTLTIEAGSSGSGLGRIALEPGSTGAVTITGAGSTWNGRLYVGIGGTGRLRIGDGGSVSGGGSTISGTAIVTGAGSSWTTSDEGVDTAALIVGDTRPGSLTIADGASVTSNSSDFVNVRPQLIGGLSSGNVTVTGQNSRWTTNTGILVGGPPVASGSPGRLSIEAGGSLAASGDVVVRYHGTLTGDGTVNANVVNESGVVAPGRNPDEVTGATFGTLTVDGDYAQPNGTLRIRLGGAASESDYDRLDVSGALALNGLLFIGLANSFVPSAGDEFDILDWGSLSGRFNHIHFRPLPSLALGWDTSRLYTEGVISVVAVTAPIAGPGLLSSADTAIAIDMDAVFVAAPPAHWEGSSSPAHESAVHAIDQFLNPMFKPGTKYLNFGEERSGIIITNSDGPVDVNFMSLTTANDFVERDPASYELYGTNDPITSAPNSNSNGTEAWTLISSGPLSLPGTAPSGGGDDARFTRTFMQIDSPTNYSSYRLIFPTVKDPAAANSMQIADIQFYTALGAPGDFDGDGDADAADLAIWRSAMDLMNLADADNDYDSDGADFLLWQRYFRSFVPAVSANAAVPEPMSWTLLSVAAVGIRRLRGSSPGSLL